MVDLMTRSLGLSGRERVVDAYCGVGTFTVLLAPFVGHVTGIEESASAVADARINAAGLDNVEFVEARTEDALRRSRWAGGRPGVGPAAPWVRA